MRGKPLAWQEKDGSDSMRRIMAAGCFANAVRISWDVKANWQIIAIFLGVGLLLLGICTASEMIELFRGTKAVAKNGQGD